jgi:acyl carrier protein
MIMKLMKIINHAFGNSSAAESDDTVLVNLPEWDSMGHMLFISQVEEQYSIELSGDEIADTRTIGDIKKLILSKGKEL